MIDIETHRIVDIIYSRKDSDVNKWLKPYLNLKLVSGDGAISFKKVIDNKIVQVSDRFHILKNLTSYCKDFLLRKYPTYVYLNLNTAELKQKYKLFVK